MPSPTSANSSRARELRNIATDALLRLSRLSGSQSLHAEAVGAARRLVHIDPLWSSGFIGDLPGGADGEV
jgi:hypothetical protein